MVILFRLRTDCPSDRPSIQSRARPTDSPSRLTETQNKYCVGCYDIYSIHSHYKGNHKRGAAAERRNTSFVGRPTAAHFVFAALNRVNIVEDTAILVFHVRVIVLHVRRHSRFMIPRRSYHARLRADKDRHDTIPRRKKLFSGKIKFSKEL